MARIRISVHPTERDRHGRFKGKGPVKPFQSNLPASHRKAARSRSRSGPGAGYIAAGIGAAVVVGVAGAAIASKAGKPGGKSTVKDKNTGMSTKSKISQVTAAVKQPIKTVTSAATATPSPVVPSFSQGVKFKPSSIEGHGGSWEMDTTPRIPRATSGAKVYAGTGTPFDFKPYDVIIGGVKSRVTQRKF